MTTRSKDHKAAPTQLGITVYKFFATPDAKSGAIFQAVISDHHDSSSYRTYILGASPRRIRMWVRVDSSHLQALQPLNHLIGRLVVWRGFAGLSSHFGYRLQSTRMVAKYRHRLSRYRTLCPDPGSPTPVQRALLHSEMTSRIQCVFWV